MSEQKMTESRPVGTVQATIIGTGDSSRLVSGMVAKTPGVSTPNVTMNVVTPIMALAVRFYNTFLTTLLGAMGAAGLVPDGNIFAADDFTHRLYACALFALSAALIDLLKNSVTIGKRWEEKYPLLTGSV